MGLQVNWSRESFGVISKGAQCGFNAFSFYALMETSKRCHFWMYCSFIGQSYACFCVFVYLL